MIAIRAAFACVLASGCLIACNDKDPAAPQEDPVPSGRLVDADGKGVPGALVRVLTADHLPSPEEALSKGSAAQALAFLARTDGDGGYSLPGLPPGLYNVLGAKDGLASFRDSVFVSRGTQSLPEDTLRPTGSFAGTLQIQPGDDARLFLVQVLGTPCSAYPDHSGRFLLSGLAQGTYAARVLSPKPEYRNPIFRVGIRASMRDSAAKPIAPVFTGIPVVRGIRVAIDTLRGTARISWDKPDFARIGRILIERDEGGSRVYSFFAKNAEDTVFIDTLFPGRGFADTLIQRGADSLLMTDPLGRTLPVLFPIDTVPKRLSYRVILVDRGDVFGPFDERISATAPPPEVVRTYIGFGDSGEAPYVSAGDSGTVRVRCSNRTRGLKRLVWTDTLGNVLRTASLSGTEAEDSLRFRAPAKIGYNFYRVRVTDEAGITWIGETAVEIVSWKRLADRPMPANGGVGNYPVNLSTVSVGGKLYAFGSRGEFSFSASSSYDPATGRWTAIAKPPFLGRPIAAGGKVYMLAGDSLAAYDPAADAWSVKGSFRLGRFDRESEGGWAVGRYIVAMACCGFGSIGIYDTGTDAFGTVAFPGWTANGYQSFPAGGRLLIPTFDARIFSLDPATGSVEDWAPRQMALNSLHAELNGYHYFLPQPGFAAAMDVYDEDRNSWKTETGPAGQTAKLIAAGGKLYSLSLQAQWTPVGYQRTLLVRSHVPGSPEWDVEAALPFDRSRFEAETVAGELYILGYSAASEEQEPSLPILFRIPP